MTRSCIVRADDLAGTIGRAVLGRPPKKILDADGHAKLPLRCPTDSRMTTFGWAV